MISALRILAWRALQCAKLVLRDKCPLPNARTANSGITQEKQSAIQKYLWSRKSITVKKTILGGSRGSNQTGSAAPREADVSGVLISQRPVANLFGRVGPLLSGAIRRLSTQRSSQSSYPVFIRNSAPLFALVGVTLVATEDELMGKARSEVKQRGFVTREEELEAICGSIRNAIYKSGWLESLQCDMPAKKRAPEEDSAAPPPQYSLQDLDIGGVIDKGCNAAVYAARWKDDSDDEPEAGPSTAHHEDPRPAMSPQAAAQVNLPSYQSSGSFLRASPFHYSNLNLHSESLLDETIARTVSVEALFDSRPPQHDHTEEPNLSSLSFIAPSASGQLAEAAQQSGSPATAVGLTLSDGQFGRPGVARPKKVSFNVPSNVDSNGNGRLSPLRDEDPPEPSGVPSSKYPLAVKLVFNYEAASNAPAILSALYRELLPARSMQVHAPSYTMLEVLQAVVPYHPNLVDMPCAFVDRVPLLEGGLQLYPNALPARLNPLGVGRNMSLFCVMRRYDLTLARYLLLHPRPSCRTALLLLTQLLEALHHLHLHHIAHRDLKPDNILLLVDEGLETPWLVVTDFGCSLAASSESGLRVPFVSREAEPRQGNAALMAPEVKSARPGLLQSVDFSKCDLWAAGTLAYQFFGLPNPFLCAGENGSPRLDSMSYSERDLPDMRDTDAPLTVRRLVADLLRRRPAQRPSASVAATLSQLCLWGPSEWLQRHSAARPQREQVMEWLLTLTAKVLFENRAVSAATEYRLVSTFLSRVHFSDVIRAINWNSAF